MIHNIIIPSPGESISEVEMGQWSVEDGASVQIDQEIGEIESDKATLPLLANASGKINLILSEGETIEVGGVAATIDDSFATETISPTIVATSNLIEEETSGSNTEKPEVSKAQSSSKESASTSSEDLSKVKITPVAQTMMAENNLSVEEVLKGLRRITKTEIDAVVTNAQQQNTQTTTREATRSVDRKPMSSLRKKLSERLVSVKNETAMLTTFNEVDMSAVMEVRKKYQPKFVEKHGIKLGFMSLFTKAVSKALDLHPLVNAYMENDEIVTPTYHDIGIAVSSAKGLMVPVVRNAEIKSIPTIEKEIKELATKVRNKRLTLEEMSGGTFTITNGGVFGSMMSTPIINPPQSGILGMHNIVERPIAVNGKVEIRPVMYIALSYDHRVIDGKDSVGFLMKIKQFLEHPETLFTGNTLYEEMFEL